MTGGQGFFAARGRLGTLHAGGEWRGVSRDLSASLLATGGRQGPLHNNSLEGPLPEGNLCPQRLSAINARAITKLPSGRQSGNYPETALWETRKPFGVFFGARLQVTLGRVDRLRSHMNRPLAVAHELTASRWRMNQ